MVRVMSRGTGWVAAMALVASVNLAGAAPIAEGTTKGPETPAEKVRKDLDKSVSIEITEQPLTLAMNQLRDQTKINIIVDRLMLNQMGIDPESVPVTVNLKDVKLRTALRTILTPQNLSFAVIGDTVLVSTDDMCMQRQMRQRINVDVEKTEVGVILRKLARDTGTNLVIDPKLVKEIATPVTISLEEVPFEDAVRTLTELSDLKVVRIGRNVLFICNEARAAKMRQDPEFHPNPNPGGGPVPFDGIPRQGIQILPGINVGPTGGPGGPLAPPGIELPAPPPVQTIPPAPPQAPNPR